MKVITDETDIPRVIAMDHDLRASFASKATRALPMPEP
jgi:hypothetical protein